MALTPFLYILSAGAHAVANRGTDPETTLIETRDGQVHMRGGVAPARYSSLAYPPGRRRANGTIGEA